MATTVTWVQDVNGNYEISSPEHLKQLMNQGTLYTDAGTLPSDYWGSSTNYIQTADIDLLNDSTDIKPIGIDGDIFDGSYDGGEYSISNYSYLDPNFSTVNSCEPYVGLFGYCTSNYIKNIRLNGVWTIEGFSGRVGFLAGYFYNSSSGIVSNIEGNFSTGSFINTNNVDSNVRVGSLFGYIRAFEFTSVTVRGSIDFIQDTTKTYASGGIAGQIEFSNDNASASMIRNLTTFPSGIGGRYVGGIFGYYYVTSYKDISLTNVINCMIGDIFSDHPTDQNIGGIIGYTRNLDLSTSYVNNMINSMTGDMYGSVTNAPIGGLMGNFDGYGTVPSERLFNYMTGNIYMTGSNTSVRIGGIIGYLKLYDPTHGDTGTLSNCINAMNGNIDGEALFGNIVSGSPTPTNTITNTSFGLTFTANAFNTGTPTGLLTNTEFTDLPYVDLTGTDTDGNPHDFEFVYGNLSGNSSYSDYTHLVLHRGDIYTPYEVTYGLPSNNTTVYLTYVNVQTMAVSSPSGLTGSTTVSGITIVVPSLIDISVRSINLLVTIVEVSGAIGYRLTIEGPTGGEVTKVSGTTVLQHNLTSFEPETQYTVKMYADTGSGYVLSEETVITTLVNTASSYDLTDFEVDGLVTIGSLGSNLDLVFDDLLTTGDVIGVPLASKPSVPSVFIKRGETLSIKDVDSTIIPFSTSSGNSQEVSVVLSEYDV